MTKQSKIPAAVDKLMHQQVVIEQYDGFGVVREDLVPGEKWRLFPDYPAYEVSSFGRIRRAVSGPSTHIGLILKPSTTKKGYLVFGLMKQGKLVSIAAHIAVCLVWHGPRPSAGHQAAHDNGVKKDNRPENVYWATAKQNAEDSIRHGTMVRGERVGSAKLNATQVVEIRCLYGTPRKTDRTNVAYLQCGTRWTARALADRFGVSHYTIQGIIYNKKWRHV